MPEDDAKPEKTDEAEVTTEDDGEPVDPADELNDLVKDVEAATKATAGETDGATVADGEEAAPAAVEGAEPEADEFDAEILHIAAQMGKSEQWARSKGSVRNLETALGVLAEERQEAKTPARAKADDKPPDIVVPKIEPGEDIDEATAKEMNAAIAELHTQLTSKFDETTKAHTERMDRAERVVQQQQVSMFNRAFKEMVAGNSNGYADLLKDPANQEKVKEEMRDIVAGKLSRRRAIPDDAELYRQALKQALGDRSAQAAREELDGELGARKKAMIRRPGGKAQKVSKEAHAQLALREKLIALNAGIGEESA